jgi:hypothetical protein
VGAIRAGLPVSVQVAGTRHRLRIKGWGSDRTQVNDSYPLQVPTAAGLDHNRPVGFIRVHACGLARGATPMNASELAPLKL